MQREIVVPHATSARSATHMRSTVLQSSVTQLRQRGHFDRYLHLLDPNFRSVILESLAPSWLPIEVALAHYRACEALELSETETLAMGTSVGDRIQGTFMGTLMKSAAGVGPLRLLTRADRMYARMFQGGGSIQIVQTGPKDAEIELQGTRLSEFTYFRTGFRGIVLAGFKVVGVASHYVKAIGYRPARDAFALRCSWV